MKAKVMMTTVVAVVDPDENLEHILCRCSHLHPSELYVLDNEQRLLGVISPFDILKTMAPFYLNSHLSQALPDDITAVKHRFENVKGQCARDIMTTDVATCHPDDHGFTVYLKLVEERVHVIPVVRRNGVMVGKISRLNLIEYLSKTVNCSCPFSHARIDLKTLGQDNDTLPPPQNGA
ncbi:CBS domain-containing protein [Desulfovibrio inopinatus]|uniref:CBS domain-containing protein n=1 Tax=Desulfovibrio inopinatus TaxID=102109 RepID=UPI000684F133|nr:CBS domain-containing protein [Desulfovibrio inopinatus]